MADIKTQHQRGYGKDFYNRSLLVTHCVFNLPACSYQNLPSAALQGWGLIRFPLFRYFPNFSTSPKYMLAIEYHVHIWQVLPQLRCGNTCQICMWLKVCSRYFCDFENFAYGEIDERSFSNPRPLSFVRWWKAELAFSTSSEVDESSCCWLIWRHFYGLLTENVYSSEL